MLYGFRKCVIITRGDVSAYAFDFIVLDSYSEVLVCDIGSNKLCTYSMALLSSTPRRSSTPQVIDLTFLTEEEEVSLRAVLQEDARLQQDEDRRLKYYAFGCLLNYYGNYFNRALRDSINEEAIRFASSRPGSQCTRCGTRFGWIFNTGALCPTCSERVCKRDRLYDSYAHTWMCTLCDKRM